jgi:hypothetical protein
MAIGFGKFQINLPTSNSLKMNREIIEFSVIYYSVKINRDYGIISVDFQTTGQLFDRVQSSI